MRVSEPVEVGKEGRGGIYRVGMSWSSDSLEPGGRRTRGQRMASEERCVFEIREREIETEVLSEFFDPIIASPVIKIHHPLYLVVV